MKNIIFSLFAVAFLIFFIAELQAQTATRIKFARNATSAVVTGKLKGYDDKRIYLIRLNAGQTLSTEQMLTANSNKYITLSISNPIGQQVGDMDASCHNRYEIVPTVAGDYRIEVTQCQKADAWKGRFKFRVKAF